MFPPPLKTGASIAAFLAVAFSQSASGQVAPPKGMKGMPPRTNAAEYQAAAKAGDVTIAADFEGHAAATDVSTYTLEDYVSVEVALYGPADARLKLSFEDFSLRVDGKKTTLPAQPYELIFKSLKDPEWVPPAPAEGKSKGGINSGGGGEADSPPPVVHMPPAMQRAMEQNVQNAVLPEGERALPQAGLLFFKFGGKTKGIRSLELVYSGPAGKASVPLQP
jgi:hypothetical protein